MSTLQPPAAARLDAYDGMLAADNIPLAGMRVVLGVDPNDGRRTFALSTDGDFGDVDLLALIGGMCVGIVNLALNQPERGEAAVVET
jgi:hypothetical protein